MSELPNRSVKVVTEKQSLEIIDAYMDGVLKSRDEVERDIKAYLAKLPSNYGPTIGEMLDATWEVTDDQP